MKVVGIKALQAEVQQMVAVLDREVSALDEIRSSWESVFSQVSSDAQALEIYTELAQLEGKSLAEVLSYPTIISQKLILASEFQQQASSYHDIVNFYLEQETKDDEKLAYEMRQKGIYNLQKARKSRTKCIEILTEIINNYWNYLTLEAQDKFKNWGKILLEKSRDWAKEYQVKEGSEELRLAYLDFIAAIIKADDLNRAKPKLRKFTVEPKIEEESENEQSSWNEEEEFIDMLIEMGKEPEEAEYIQEEMEAFERIIEKLNKE